MTLEIKHTTDPLYPWHVIEDGRIVARMPSEEMARHVMVGLEGTQPRLGAGFSA